MWMLKYVKSIWTIILLFFYPARLDPLAHGVLHDLRPAVRRVPDLHHLRHQPGATLEQTKGRNRGGGCTKDAGEAGSLSLNRRDSEENSNSNFYNICQSYFFPKSKTISDIIYFYEIRNTEEIGIIRLKFIIFYIGNTKSFLLQKVQNLSSLLY